MSLGKLLTRRSLRSTEGASSTPAGANTVPTVTGSISSCLRGGCRFLPRQLLPWEQMPSSPGQVSSPSTSSLGLSCALRGMLCFSPPSASGLCPMREKEGLCGALLCPFQNAPLSFSCSRFVKFVLFQSGGCIFLEPSQTGMTSGTQLQLNAMAGAGKRGGVCML